MTSRVSRDILVLKVTLLEDRLQLWEKNNVSTSFILFASKFAHDLLPLYSYENSRTIVGNRGGEVIYLWVN